jgi:hypothetical protein
MSNVTRSIFFQHSSLSHCYVITSYWNMVRSQSQGHYNSQRSQWYTRGIPIQSKMWILGCWIDLGRLSADALQNKTNWYYKVIKDCEANLFCFFVTPNVFSSRAWNIDGPMASRPTKAKSAQQLKTTVLVFPPLYFSWLRGSGPFLCPFYYLQI